MAEKKTKPGKTKKFNSKKFILNCNPSARTEDDWTFEDALEGGVVSLAADIPAKKDLRAR